jgi:MFS family permease
VRSTFQSLHVRNYRLFAIGQLISLIFGWVQITAQDWLVLQVSHNSASALGVVTALQFTPLLLVGLYAGKLADHLDKRLLLMVLNGAWLVLSALMGVLVLSGTVTLWHVYVFAVLWGTVTAAETPFRQSFIHELVGPTLLPNALSLNAASFNSARVIGPAIAGFAIAGLGTGSAFLANAASYVVPVVALSLMRPAELERVPRPVADTRVVDGLRYVWRRPDLLLPIALMLVIGMVGYNFQLTLPVLSKNVFHTGPTTFGLLVTALALGSIGGALAGSRRRERPSVFVVLGGAVAFGILGTLTAFMPTYPLTALLLVPTGFSMIYLAQAANQRVQLGTDAAYRGRVMALYFLVFMGTNPVGAPLVGWVAQVAGPRAAIWLGTTISLAVAVIALAVRLRRSGERIRLQLVPVPKLYVDVLPVWQGDEHGAVEAAQPPGRRPHPVAPGRRARPDRAGAQLSGVDS